MKRPVAVAGLVILLALPAVADGATLDALLGRVQNIVTNDAALTSDVAAFTAATLSAETLPYVGQKVELTGEDVIHALATAKRGTLDQDLCTTKLKLKTDFACLDLINEMQSISDREMEVVRLGHRLQGIATGYEQSVREFSAEPQKLTAAYAETLRTWGIPPLPNQPTDIIRFLPVPDDSPAILSSLLSTIESLDEDQRREQEIAAVWRYTYGLAFVKESASDARSSAASGTERQYLAKRWENVESELETVREELRTRIDPPLKKGEIGIFLMPLDTVGEKDITLWATFRTSDDATRDTRLPLEDIGLRWGTPLEPVLPSLLKEGTHEPILAGHYPPPPTLNESGAVLQDGGGGLCHTVDGSQGYLCRKHTPLSDQDTCDEPPPDPKEDTIILSSCTPKRSESGADLTNICADMRANLPANTKACAPGTDVSYPNSILGNACFVRECAERTTEHDITPGRIPFVEQESPYPWSGCPATPPAPMKLDVAPLLQFPILPPYNPSMRARELDQLYCQAYGKPPLSPPVLCGPTLTTATATPMIFDAAKGLQTTGALDSLVSEDMETSMESMGLERGSLLYRDYLRQVSDTLSGNLRAVVSMLQNLAQSSFPTTMCPLNPMEDRSVCSAMSSSSRPTQ